MVEFTLTPRPLLDGANLSLGENRIVERDDLALVSVATPQGGETALAEALARAWSLSMPGPTRSTLQGEIRAVRSTPDQMMLVFPHSTPDARGWVQKNLGGTGYFTEQTDVWAVLDISGPDTMTALERICPLDLDDLVFPIDASARTMMAHLGAMIIRLEHNRFLLLSASSSAASFLNAVETSFRNVLP